MAVMERISRAPLLLQALLLFHVGTFVVGSFSSSEHVLFGVAFDGGLGVISDVAHGLVGLGLVLGIVLGRRSFALGYIAYNMYFMASLGVGYFIIDNPECMADGFVACFTPFLLVSVGMCIVLVPVFVHWSSLR